MLLLPLVYLALFVLGLLLIPFGNEKSLVRRLPWVTFGLIGVNFLVFMATLPVVQVQEEAHFKSLDELVLFLRKNPQVLYDSSIRERLLASGVLSQAEREEIEAEYEADPNLRERYEEWAGSTEGTKLMDQFEGHWKQLLATRESHLFYQYGLAPNGEAQTYQLITSAFLHGGWMHLIGNMIFLFAIGFSLEDLWGRPIFLGFYLLGAVAAGLPAYLAPSSLPTVGASGAVSATMGGFLVRLHMTRIQIAFGYLSVPAIVYFPIYFGLQLFMVWLNKITGADDAVAYGAHFAGFAFGIAFAWLMKLTRTEEKYIHPKIEAKVSFEAAPAVTQALALLDRGEMAAAERRLQSYLASNPDDLNALLALIQVCQRSGRYDQLNDLYARVIRHHLANGDKEAALMAYDHLLSAFPDDRVEPRLPLKEWMAICDYLRLSGMAKAASVEYERLVKSSPDDPLLIHACVRGGDTALASGDVDRARWLYERAMTLNPPHEMAARIRNSLMRCGVSPYSTPQRAG